MRKKIIASSVAFFFVMVGWLIGVYLSGWEPVRGADLVSIYLGWGVTELAVVPLFWIGVD